jgi:hypothetical protein
MIIDRHDDDAVDAPSLDLFGVGDELGNVGDVAGRREGARHADEDNAWLLKIAVGTCLRIVSFDPERAGSRSPTLIISPRRAFQAPA